MASIIFLSKMSYHFLTFYSINDFVRGYTLDLCSVGHLTKEDCYGGRVVMVASLIVTETVPVRVRSITPNLTPLGLAR